MIKYCENIRPGAESVKTAEEKAQRNAEDINLAKEKGWEKEAKSGCQVIQGKKTKADEVEPKKVQKPKKVKSEDPNSESLSHGIDTLNRFHELNVLPPVNGSEIDQAIKQLGEKIEILKSPSEEAVAAFKAKAEKEFDRLHGFHDEEEEEEKPARQEKKREKSEKVQLQGADFPELN
jgi:hypothetical protein